MINGSMTKKTEAEMEKWRKSSRMIVTSLTQIYAYKDADSRSCRDVVTDLVNGCIVEGPLQLVGTRSQVLLPDGRKAWVDNDDIADFSQWASQPFSSRQILDMAYSMIGAPYLWGGTSTKMLDCSGLAKVSYFSNGIILMRDASQQATTGTRIEAANWRSCQAGDLLFFGNAKTKRVTHVAIYDENGFYVHSSGKVRHNSVDSKSDEYLSTPFLHAVRIAGNEGTRGITRVESHPWYFNIDK
ncbi:MAG: C40 family peptidase [Muribaculaceae bacterium]|nr:C40 family peptidase [Muribaculaceae bacterium]